MQRMSRLMQVMNAASSVAEIVREKQVYRFGVRPGSALYVHTEGAEVRLFRWELPTIEIVAQLQASFGWRIASEQDDAGVYFVAKRRAFVGAVAAGTFSLTVPQDAHVILRLERCAVWMTNTSGTLEIPANQPPRPPRLPSQIAED
jgi:hypothetical protein